MTSAEDAWKWHRRLLEKQIDMLFTPGCDPYQAAAAVLYDKSLEEITEEARDVVKHVVCRVIASRGNDTLRRAADLFHEIGSAIAVKGLLAECRNAVLAEKLCENKRSFRDLKLIACEGFELCTRTLGVSAMKLERRDSLSETGQALQCAAYLFHEIKMAVIVEIDEQQGLVVAETTQLKRSPTQLRSLSAEGFECCVRALAAMGATDVTIHECGEKAMEEHW